MSDETNIVITDENARRFWPVEILEHEKEGCRFRAEHLSTGEPVKGSESEYCGDGCAWFIDGDALCPHPNACIASNKCVHPKE